MLSITASSGGTGLDLFAAKFAVVTKLALLTHGFVFALFVFCGKVFRCV